MAFPVYLHLFGFTLHPHVVCEGSAYALGLGLQQVMRRRQRMRGLVPRLDGVMQLWMLSGLALGALVGARFTAWIDMPHIAGQGPLAWMLGGKSIVGAIIGGWIGVEIAKRVNGVRQSTGDAWVVPLLASIALGRVGCFLTGLSDHTYGTQTRLPWGVDFGDGILRHPTQLYESIYCLALIPVFLLAKPLQRWRRGALFRLFVAAYMLFRVWVEFLKPRPRPALGMSWLQLVALAAALWALGEIIWPRRPVREGSPTAAAAEISADSALAPAQQRI